MRNSVFKGSLTSPTHSASKRFQLRCQPNGWSCGILPVCTKGIHGLETVREETTNQ
ncbi:hypothetical protein SCG7086_BJ_00140 [Chlamydiales bacterium SCGC AG-110-P3]|nr:hypothetical protein SCG7086_BJ_00140 [Chlamydiales bacterium SCGC AG-110-P3]